MSIVYHHLSGVLVNGEDRKEYEVVYLMVVGVVYLMYVCMYLY